jgi:hypothetical protein
MNEQMKGPGCTQDDLKTSNMSQTVYTTKHSNIPCQHNRVFASKKLQRYALMAMLGFLNAKALQMYRFKIKAVVVKWLQQRQPMEFFVQESNQLE